MTPDPAHQVAPDWATRYPAPLVPTPTTGPTVRATAGRATAAEIAEFLRHLTRFHSPAQGEDPADHAMLLAHKAELFTRITGHTRTGHRPAPDPTTPDDTASTEGGAP